MPVKLQRLWIQLTADRRRFALLCTVLGVGMLLWARLIVVSRMPRTAIADDTPVATDVKPKKAAKAQGTAKEEDTPVIVPDANPIAVELSTKFGRDPFVISPHYFPKPTSFTEPSKEPGKSQSKPAEEPFQIEARITAQLRSVVDRLRLEAAVSGSMAVISGKTYRTGDEIEVEVQGGEPVTFRLVEVKHRSAVLECKDRQFEIQMTTPGN